MGSAAGSIGGEKTVGGRRLVFGFRARNFQPAESTEVEVRFEPVPGGTRVTVEHRGWDQVPLDHPARRGFGEPAFSNMLGGWWADQLVAVGARAAATGS